MRSPNSSFFVLHSSFVNDFHLLSYTLFVYGFEHFFDKVGIHAAQGALRAALLQNLVVAARLKDGYAVLLLVSTNFAGHAHTLGQHLDQVVVTFVNLRAQLVQIL